MDRLLQDDIERSQTTDPAEKLVQALEMMATGIGLKRAALRAAQPSASERDIDAQLERWLTADG
jgi:Rv0078B-related antitoxin